MVNQCEFEEQKWSQVMCLSVWDTEMLLHSGEERHFPHGNLGSTGKAH